MFYLVIKNLNFEACIDKNSKDIYADGNIYNCHRTLSYTRKNIVKNIRIRCLEDPSVTVDAIVYSD